MTQDLRYYQSSARDCILGIPYVPKVVTPAGVGVHVEPDAFSRVVVSTDGIGTPDPHPRSLVSWRV